MKLKQTESEEVAKISPVGLEEGVGLPPLGMDLKTDTGGAGQTWDRVIQGLLIALTFLLPILFTPWTFEPLEFSKQMLLFTLTTAALVAWLLKLLVTRTWRFVKTPLDMPLWVLLGIYLLASLFSVDRVASFLGFYGSFSGNFFQILFLAIFYYLIINNFETASRLRKLFGYFFFSIFLSLLYAILQFFGLFVVRLPLAKLTSFNTIGGLLALSFFSAFAVIMALGIGEDEKSWLAFGTGKLWRILTVVFALVVLMTVNFSYAWVALLVGLLLYLVFQVGLAKNFEMKKIVAPLVLVIFVVAFLVMQLVFPTWSAQDIFHFNLPVEIHLDYTTAMPAIKGLVAQKPILGSGPNTFLYAFSKYRDQNFNLSPLWNIRFDKGPSEAAEYLVGTGVLGLLAFEILTISFLVYGWFFLFRKRDEDGWNLALTLYAGFTLLWVSHWFFFFNTVSAFSFWLMLAGFMAVARSAGGEKVKTYGFSFASSPRQTVSIISAVSLSLVLVIVFVFFAAAVYASDIFYRSGVLAGNNKSTYDQAQRDFEEAIRLNRFRPDYYLTYGEFLFVRINQELSKPQPNLQNVQNWLAASISTSRSAVDLSPLNWGAWERLANIYTAARPLVSGVNQFIIDYLNKATENNPKNPILFLELGQAYRLNARHLDPSVLGTGPDSDNDGLTDSQEQVLGCDPHNPSTTGDGILDGTKVLAGLSCSGPGPLPDAFVAKYIKTDAESLLKAEDAFKKAVALKSDYANGYYQLALTYEQAGKLDDAIATMEKVLAQFPTSLDLKFELGRMYYNAGRINDAAIQFQEIVRVSPNNSNALYSLALSDERLGQPGDALALYQKVLELNPNNQAIEAKIQELQKSAGLAPGKKGK